MSYKEIFTCAGCGKEKSEVNHWWCVSHGQLHNGSFHIELWKYPIAVDPYYESYCGQNCVIKALSEWMVHG